MTIDRLDCRFIVGLNRRLASSIAHLLARLPDSFTHLFALCSGLHTWERFRWQGYTLACNALDQ